MSEEEKLRQLIVHHAHLRDDWEWDEWSQYFAPDAILIRRDSPIVGRDRIRVAQIEQARMRGLGKHLLGQPVVTVDGDRAVARTDAVYISAKGESAFGISVVCQYCDVWFRDPEQGWKLEERAIRYVG